MPASARYLDGLMTAASRVLRPAVTVAALLLAFSPELAAQSGKDGPPPAAPVGLDPVRSETLAETMPVIGRIVAAESGVVATRIAERVAEVLVRPGDRVEEGTVLARLSSDRLVNQRTLRLADRERAAAQVTRARATRSEAQRTLERVSALRGSTAHRQDRQDQAERDAEIAASDLRQAEADLQRADASLALANLALADADIAAPYPGVVTARHVAAGNYVGVGDPIMTLLNDRVLEIEADVPALRTDGLLAGTRVVATLQNGNSFGAMVRAVVPDENPRTRTRSVRLIPMPDAAVTALAGNQSVTVEMPVGAPREVITVHKDAVIVRGDRSIVYLVEDGKAQVRPVRRGRAVGNRFEVLDGLKPGDVVVVRGNERLRPGQSVRPLASG